MKGNALLAVVRYIPDIDRKEVINVGVVLHSTSHQYLKSYFINKYDRISKFDDELDMDFFRIYIETLSDEFTYSLNFIEKGLDIEDDKLLYKLSMNYVNQFQFEIMKVNIIDQNIETAFLGYVKFMLHYDFDKSQRLKKKEKIQIAKELFEMNSIEFEIVKQNNIQGIYNEYINPEFRVGDYLIKYFRFDESNYKTFTDQVKAWSFNTHELKQMGYNVIFVVEDLVENEYSKRYIDILMNTSEKVYQDFDDPHLMSFLNKQGKYLDNLEN